VVDAYDAAIEFVFNHIPIKFNEYNSKYNAMAEVAEDTLFEYLAQGLFNPSDTSTIASSAKSSTTIASSVKPSDTASTYTQQTKSISKTQKQKLYAMITQYLQQGDPDINNRVTNFINLLKINTQNENELLYCLQVLIHSVPSPGTGITTEHHIQLVRDGIVAITYCINNLHKKTTSFFDLESLGVNSVEDPFSQLTDNSSQDGQLEPPRGGKRRKSHKKTIHNTCVAQGSCNHIKRIRSI
jgi:hypothetical protein